MKRFFSIFLIIIFSLLSFCSCAPQKNEERLTIVTTVFPPFDFARSIAGEKAEIIKLVPNGSESHSFEPTPTQIKTVEDCDLFICIGGESENWAERIAGNKSSGKTLSLINTVTLLESHSGEEHEHHEESGDHHHHEHDEHIWTSVKNAVKMSEAIFNALCEVDADNKDYYENNFKSLKNSLDALDKEFQSINLQKPLFFGDRFPFLYLAKEYSFDYFAAFPGCAEQTEPDIKTLTHLIEHAKEEDVKVIYYTEFSNKKIALMLCEETGAQPLLLHSCHNVTSEEMKNGESYLSLMKRNCENIKKMAD
jgi:zinc transport system substrate-binding protein